LYRVATSDFLVQGGEGTTEILAAVDAAKKTVEPVTVRDAFVGFLQKRFPTGTGHAPKAVSRDAKLTAGDEP
jgi:hypothetical protein